MIADINSHPQYVGQCSQESKLLIS